MKVETDEVLVVFRRWAQNDGAVVTSTDRSFYMRAPATRNLRKARDVQQLGLTAGTSVHCVSKNDPTLKRCTPRNLDRFWWHLAEIFTRL